MLHAFGTYPFHNFHSVHDTRSSRLFQTTQRYNVLSAQRFVGAGCNRAKRAGVRLQPALTATTYLLCTPRICRSSAVPETAGCSASGRAEWDILFHENLAQSTKSS